MIEKLLKFSLGKIFTCMLMLILLCSCSTQDTRTVVQFASWGSKSEIDIIKPILQKFEEQNPDIKVDFMHIPQNYFQKIHLLFASNTPPDVIFINNLYLPIYANAGVLEPIDGVFDTSQYNENVLKALSFKNKLYAVPRDVSNLVVFYNKDFFDKYNVKYPDEKWTFSDFLNTAEKLTRDGKFGVSFEEKPMYILPFLMSEGGGILDDDLKTLIIDNDNSQRALNYYANLRKKYHVAPLASESASATMAQMFLQGRIAMHITGRWLVPKYREEAKFKWDIAAFPNGTAGSIVPLDASGWAISKNTKHKTEAIKLINYLSSKNNIEQLAKSGLIVPARQDAANSKYFLDGKSPKNAKVFLTIIKTAKPTPVPVNYQEITDRLTPKFERLFN